MPRIGVPNCGVGDYALTLARRLRDAHDIHSRFLVADPNWQGGDQTEGFATATIGVRRPARLADCANAQDCDAVLLQYSGYGYSRRGAPTWLAAGVRRLNRPLITMFHELFASGPVTSSGFWLSPVMRWVARRIAQASAVVFTNRAASADWLGCPATVIPVFSNLGEGDPTATLESRNKWLAVFPYQAEIVPQYWSELQRFIESVQPEQVVALGRATPQIQTALSGAPVTECGLLPPAEVSHWLRKCRYGFVGYYPQYAGKSGILAAMAAHGLAVAFSPSDAELSEGLVRGGNILHLSSAGDSAAVEQCSTNLRNWYAEHSIPATAKKYADAIQAVAC